MHLLLQTVTASAALAVTVNTAGQLQGQIDSEEAAHQRKLDRVADYVLARIDTKARTA